MLNRDVQKDKKTVVKFTNINAKKEGMYHFRCMPTRRINYVQTICPYDFNETYTFYQIQTINITKIMIYALLLHLYVL